jgi:hypothetical protein
MKKKKPIQHNIFFVWTMNQWNLFNILTHTYILELIVYSKFESKCSGTILKLRVKSNSIISKKNTYILYINSCSMDNG